MESLYNKIVSSPRITYETLPTNSLLHRPLKFNALIRSRKESSRDIPDNSIEYHGESSIVKIFKRGFPLSVQIEDVNSETYIWTDQFTHELLIGTVLSNIEDMFPIVPLIDFGVYDDQLTLVFETADRLPGYIDHRRVLSQVLTKYLYLAETFDFVHGSLTADKIYSAEIPTDLTYRGRAITDDQTYMFGNLSDARLTFQGFNYVRNLNYDLPIERTIEIRPKTIILLPGFSSYTYRQLLHNPSTTTNEILRVIDIYRFLITLNQRSDICGSELWELIWNQSDRTKMSEACHSGVELEIRTLIGLELYRDVLEMSVEHLTG